MAQGWLRGQTVVFGLLLAGCSGDDNVKRPDPEICDDGEDNDKDGLVDCDDTADCGGLACRETFTTETGETAPPTLEIVVNDGCCDFSFGSADCPQKSIGTVSIINRDPELEGQFTASCETVGPSLQPIEWKVVGSGNQVPYLVNLPLAPESTVEVEAFFVCDAGVDQTFETVCRVVAEIEESSEEVSVEQEVTGTSTVAR